MTVRSFTLSFAALDILSERLRLGRSPFPFEIPGHGHTHDERAGIRRAVFDDLERRGLASRGHPEPVVAEALAMLARPQVAITAFASLEGGRRLFARLGAIGGRGILAVQQRQALCFDHVRPTALIDTAAGLLPEHRPGVGQSVTVELDTPAGSSTESRVATVVRPPRTGRSGQLRAVETMLAPPRLRFGQFRVLARDRHGTERNAPDLFWFDTAMGRYLSVGSTRADGTRWTTYSPADTRRIGQHLDGQLTALGG
ncbi:ESX secretion-associated protein EspG [Actinokineospora sp.]|uniref:ESX secretion-associated protein EspG n=1 Tax=Actinokineospora sp. TaxID=1872133 RepID=UPI0040380D6B